MQKKLVILFLFSISFHLHGQVVLSDLDTTKISNDDIARVKHLLEEGVKIEKERVVCWFPKDSLSARMMDSIAGMIDLGVKAAEKYIRAPLEQQRFAMDDPIECFFPADRFVSHANGSLGYVFIPFWRIKENKSPWLHEMIHILLTPKQDYLYDDWEEAKNIYPTWLHEGLADFLAVSVSKEAGWDAYDVFSDTYNPDVDRLFLQDYNNRKGMEIVSFIGSKGYPDLLTGDKRRDYAPVFYHGSTSLIKFIAENYGLDILSQSVFAVLKENETIESRTGKSLNEIKEAWYKSLGID